MPKTTSFFSYLFLLAFCRNALCWFFPLVSPRELAANGNDQTYDQDNNGDNIENYHLSGPPAEMHPNAEALMSQIS